MAKGLKYLCGALILLICLPMAAQQVALAADEAPVPATPVPVFKHHPEIEASVTCLEDSLMLNWKAYAWAGDGTDASRTNPEVWVGLNSTTILAIGEFSAANGFMFAGSSPLPGTVGPGDSVTVYAYAAGDWGNGYAGGQSSGVTVSAPTEPCGSDQTGMGRFTGGGHQVRVGDVRVTRGLTLHCDLLLSNNLEINWGGNRFHMTEHLTTVQCSDDPDIIQFPPAAPLDTLIGVGTGRYNNADGYTVEFTLRDFGEPGSGNDEMGIRIYETSNPANIVLDVPLQKISGGNLQAHYDQPHGSNG